MLEAIFLIAFVLGLGFIALEIFRKTKISHVIVLVIFGILIGPLFNFVPSGEGSLIRSLAPFMSTLALIFLLFDAGLSLNIREILKEIGKATLFTVVVFFVSSFIGAGTVSLLLGMPLMFSLLVGFIVGGVSSAIVLAMLEGSEINEEIRTMLSIESTLTDILVVVFSLVTLNMMLIPSNNPALASASDPLILLITSLSVSFVMAIIALALWIYVFSRMETHSFSYMLTLAIMLFLYVVAERTGGNGGFAIFLFGIMLGNFGYFEKYFSYLGGLRGELYKLLISEIENFDLQITFFIRTFLFVLTGLLLTFSNVTLPIFGVALIVSLLFIGIRYVVFKLFYPHVDEWTSKFVSVMLPRGLAAIVVVNILPEIVNSFGPSAMKVFTPYIGEMEALTVLVILFSNIFASAGVYLLHRDGEHESSSSSKGNGVVDKEIEELLSETVKEENQDAPKEDMVKGDNDDIVKENNLSLIHI